MPIDPAHGKFVPTGRRMAAILARVLRGEWRRARPLIRAGRMPNFLGFLERLTIALKPLLASYYLRGHGDERLRYRAPKRRRKMLAGLIEKRLEAPIATADDPGFAPQPTGIRGFFGGVANAVNRAVRRIWSKVTGYVSRIMNTKPQAEREEVLERAFGKRAAENLAREESSKVHHEGQMDAATEAGRTTMTWLANETACDFCKKLAATGKNVPIGQAFGFTAKGGAIFSPPAHPNCMCSLG